MWPMCGGEARHMWTYASSFEARPKTDNPMANGNC